MKQLKQRSLSLVLLCVFFLGGGVGGERVPLLCICFSFFSFLFSFPVFFARMFKSFNFSWRETQSWSEVKIWARRSREKAVLVSHDAHSKKRNPKGELDHVKNNCLSIYIMSKNFHLEIFKSRKRRLFVVQLPRIFYVTSKWSEILIRKITVATSVRISRMMIYFPSRYLCLSVYFLIENLSYLVSQCFPQKTFSVELKIVFSLLVLKLHGFYSWAKKLKGER